MSPDVADDIVPVMRGPGDQLQELLHAPPAWIHAYLPLIRTVCESATDGSIARQLNAASKAVPSCPISFVEQHQLPVGEAYEAFIARTATVPTRDNLHDLFNGLMWLSWPHSKRRLNELQATQISTQGISGSRGCLRDALTLFDENAAVMAAPAALIDALRTRNWHALFVDGRELWAQADFRVFGHALLEKLMRPRKAITAHVWVVPAVSDAGLAASLVPERLAAKDFLPLPVLGVPGWWSSNEHPAFYEDAQVFRPARGVRPA